VGGPIQNKRTLNRTGIPFLNRIRVLGLPFGSTEEKIEKTELAPLITPRVAGESIRRTRRPPSSPPAP